MSGHAGRGTPGPVPPWRPSPMRHRRPASMSAPRHAAPARRRPRPRLLAVPVVLVLAAAGLVLVTARTPAVAEDEAPNPNCSLTVPADPTSAAGLATPYLLQAADPGQGPCNEA